METALVSTCGVKDEEPLQGEWWRKTGQEQAMRGLGALASQVGETSTCETTRKAWDSGRWVVSEAGSESQLTRRKGIYGEGTDLERQTGRGKGVESPRLWGQSKQGHGQTLCHDRCTERRPSWSLQWKYVEMIVKVRQVGWSSRGFERPVCPWEQSSYLQWL